MALLGLTTAFLGAVFADLQGNRYTRPFTRLGYGALVAVEMGVSVTGMVSGFGDIVGFIQGVM
jgi:hypothetical protein